MNRLARGYTAELRKLKYSAENPSDRHATMPEYFMKKGSTRCCTFVLLILCWVVPPARAGLLDSLLAEIPADQRPGPNVQMWTLKDSLILISADIPDVPRYAGLLQPIATKLEARYKASADLRMKVNTAKAVGDYYLHLHQYPAAFPHLKAVMENAHDEAAAEPVVPQALVYLAALYCIKYREDTAIVLLQEATRLKQPDNSDTAFARDVCMGYEMAYIRLQLYGKALQYVNVQLSLWELWGEEYKITLCSKIDLMLRVGQEGKSTAMYKDASRLSRQLMSHSSREATQWNAICYLFLGRSEYLQGNYSAALQLLDSALLPQYAGSRMFEHTVYDLAAIARGTALLKLGREEGYSYLAGLPRDPEAFDVNSTAARVMYEYAKKRGWYQEAMGHLENYGALQDSLNLTALRGQFYKYDQRYKAALKEEKIVKLQNDALLQERGQRTYFSIFAILLLGLILVVTWLVRMARRRQATAKNERNKLIAELEKIQYKMVGQQEELDQIVARERSTIAGDIHDELSASLAALRFYVADRRARTEAGKLEGPAVVSLLAEVEDELSGIYTQSKMLLKRLEQGSPLMVHNVFALLQDLARQFGEASSLQIFTQTDGMFLNQKLTQAQHTAMYLVIRECVANTIRHSNARQMFINLSGSDGVFQFTLKDNGRGKQQVVPGKGLQSLRQRMEEIGGDLQIDLLEDGAVIKGSFPHKRDAYGQ